MAGLNHRAGCAAGTVILEGGMQSVTLYSRHGCRLCEEAKSELSGSMPSVEIREVDVDSDPRLRARYGLDIPVAVAGGRELFRHRFDPGCVEFLNKT